MPDRPRFERALFVMGNQNSGKSTRIRNMYADVRMGRHGRVPQKKVRNFRTVRLSHERRLYVRIQSPQEAGETLTRFFGKIDKAIKRDDPTARWNMVTAMQRGEGENIDDGVSVIDSFIRTYKPERVRVALIHPPAKGDLLTEAELADTRDRIRDLERPGVVVEALQIEGRGRNGLLLSDFFDFT